MSINGPSSDSVVTRNGPHSRRWRSRRSSLPLSIPVDVAITEHDLSHSAWVSAAFCAVSLVRIMSPYVNLKVHPKAILWGLKRPCTHIWGSFSKWDEKQRWTYKWSYTSSFMPTERIIRQKTPNIVRKSRRIIQSASLSSWVSWEEENLLIPYCSDG